jgi:hypothetical protein
MRIRIRYYFLVVISIQSKLVQRYVDRKGTLEGNVVASNKSGISWLHYTVQYIYFQCRGSGMFMHDPGSEFFHPGSQMQDQKDSGSQIRIRIQEFKYF